MEMKRFAPFREALRQHLPAAVTEILRREKGSPCCAIGFITTDDFYGCYLTWRGGSRDVDDYFEWENELAPEDDFLYQPLVEVVDACGDIDLCTASPEKWAFAEAFLAVLAEGIRALPAEVFAENGFAREDVLFFAAMSDGDYVEELLKESLRVFGGTA